MSNHHKAGDVYLYHKGAKEKSKQIIQMDLRCFIVIQTGSGLVAGKFQHKEAHWQHLSYLLIPRHLRTGCTVVNVRRGKYR